MEKLLDRINTPEDLRRLKVEDLSILASEVREEVISVISGVAGHFASTLGAVELTLALHYTFNGVAVKRLGIPDSFITHGTQDQLRKLCGIDQDAIAQAAIQMLCAPSNRANAGLAAKI